MRNERVYQLPRQVIDVERVADPGERVVEHLLAHQRGVDEPFRPRCGDAEQGECSQAGPARAHRMDGHHRLGLGAVAGIDGEHRAGLAIGADRFEQAADRGETVGRPGRMGVFLPGIALGGASGQVTELGAEQILRLARQDLRRVPVVLHDAPVVVDPQDQGPNGRSQGRMRAPRRCCRRRLAGVSADPGLLGVVAGLGSMAWPGPVALDAGRPGSRGTTRRDTALGNASPESAALRRYAGCHVLSPDGIAGCAPVNYGPRTARSDRSSDESPLSGKVPFMSQ